MKTIDTSAQIIISYDDSKLTEDEAISIAENGLMINTDSLIDGERLKARFVTIDKLEITDVTEVE